MFTSAAPAAVLLFAALTCGCAVVKGKQGVPITSEMTSRFQDVVAKGAVARVKGMLNAVPKLANVKDLAGGTPLINAAYHDDMALAKALLERGAEVSAAKPDGWTALHFAVWKKNRDLVKLLLDRGADANAARGDGGTPLHEAAAAGELAVVELLIAAGADVNAAKKDGWTPLKLATRRKHEAVAEALRRHGAKAETKAADADARGEE